MVGIDNYRTYFIQIWCSKTDLKEIDKNKINLNLRYQSLSTVIIEVMPGEAFVSDMQTFRYLRKK